MGSIDRTVRIVLVATLFYFIDCWDDTTQILMGVIAVILILSSINGFCLLYRPFKFSTIRKNKLKK
ncbi:YgaP family membrane protein [Flavobacterium sp.]|uniref:YgaP family membrane protein n=1 Tax=Flavobacterium sp. TaxID=239 RepID=UPI003D6C1C1D